MVKQKYKRLEMLLYYWDWYARLWHQTHNGYYLRKMLKVRKMLHASPYICSDLTRLGVLERYPEIAERN